MFRRFAPFVALALILAVPGQVIAQKVPEPALPGSETSAPEKPHWFKRFLKALKGGEAKPGTEVQPPPPAPGAPVKITLVGINDLHGNVDARTVALGSEGDFRLARIGGAEALAAYLEAVRAENPNTLVLDSGDDYQGTLSSNLSEGLAVVEAYNKIGIAATTFGNHEFDFGPSKLTEFARKDGFFNHPQGTTRAMMERANYPYVSVNVTNAGSEDLRGFPTKDGQPAIPRSKIFNLGGVQVGVIGATTVSTPNEALPVSVQGLAFQQLRDRVFAEASALRAKGVQVVVLIAHAGGVCDMSKPAQQGEAACIPAVPPGKPVGSTDDEITALLRALPQGTLDAVMAGHVHSPQRHFIFGTPVVQTFGFSSSFSRIDLHVNPSAPATAPRAVRIARTQIDEPTYLCHQTFSNFPTFPGQPVVPSCNNEIERMGLKFPANLGQQLPPTYHGKPIFIFSQDPRNPRGLIVDPRAPKVVGEVAKALAPFRASTGSAKVVGQLAPRPLVTDRNKESPLNNCLADIMLGRVKSFLPKTGLSLFISHSGGIRASLAGGTITHGQAFEIYPFGSHLAIAQLTGAELEQLGGILGQAPKNAAVISSGWKARLAIDAEGKAVFPRHRGFLKPDGHPVDPRDLVTIVTDEFNVTPGGKSDAIMARARAAGQIRIFNGKGVPNLVLLDQLEAAFAVTLTNPPGKLPVSCTSSTLDRTELVPN